MKTYTPSEANKLLPALKQSLELLRLLKKQSDWKKQEINAKHFGNKTNLEEYKALLMDLEQINETIDKIVNDFEEKGIFIRDIERGVVDFSAIRFEQLMFLCWFADFEDQVMYYHGTAQGTSSRRKISKYDRWYKINVIN